MEKFSYTVKAMGHGFYELNFYVPIEIISERFFKYEDSDILLEIETFHRNRRDLKFKIICDGSKEKDRGLATKKSVYNITFKNEKFHKNLGKDMKHFLLTRNIEEPIMTNLTIHGTNSIKAKPMVGGNIRNPFGGGLVRPK